MNKGRIGMIHLEFQVASLSVKVRIWEERERGRENLRHRFCYNYEGDKVSITGCIMSYQNLMWKSLEQHVLHSYHRAKMATYMCSAAASCNFMLFLYSGFIFFLMKKSRDNLDEDVQELIKEERATQPWEREQCEKETQNNLTLIVFGRCGQRETGLSFKILLLHPTKKNIKIILTSFHLM